jgi:hypothetical protein
MSDYDNSLRGALFVNERKQSDNHPDYKGSLETDDGREFWVSAWIKTPRGGGNKYISLALTPKDENSSQPARTNQTKSASDFLEQHRDKIDKHKQAAAPSAPRQPQQPAPDYDSFDDDIPF